MRVERARRYAAAVASTFATLALVGCGGLGLLPYQSDVCNSSFKTYKEVETAYETVTPGATRASDLAAIGFDSSLAPNVEVLSYLGIIERFMPRDSIRFDNLDPKVQGCIDARDRCTAYVFKPEHLQEERVGNFFLDVFGFQRTTYDHGWSAEVVLLIQDGRVAYKVMSGKPRIDEYHDKVQPLGPFQDITGTVVRSASSFLKY
ncbi:MAG: hypothetical protein HY243_04015 [Proteobacteria bacterium]|nr:hypothetical protein [Pseudomonadota bacterium]